MSWIKIILINLSVFVGLILMSEISLRLVWTGHTCITRDCDFSRVSKLEVNESNADFTANNIGLTEYHDVLGYQPKPGFDGIIDAAGWNGKSVTIDDNGYRSNGITHAEKDLDTSRIILTVGDSFTFGDQVNNDETWPACIEKHTKRVTLNAGAPGYGSAQAVRRAMDIQKYEEIDTLILSILLNDDLHRDQLNFRSGAPRPAVVYREGRLSYAEIPPVDSPGTKWNPKEPNLLLSATHRYSMLGARILKAYDVDLTGMLRSERHPEAATLDQIIKFTITEFARIEAPHKIVVFQYTQHDIPELSAEVQKTRDAVTEISTENGIPVVDTFDALKREYSSGKEMVWDIHHTAYGNSIVCDEIVKSIPN
ncbi:MAG: GDSL-type esterase/lipase family protein [Granulosicoccus sp.]